MSQKEYIKIKLDLINKLAEYIISKPDLYKKYSDCSYVIYIKSNYSFNAKNKRLIESLKREKKKIVRAQFVENNHVEWRFTTLN